MEGAKLAVEVTGDCARRVRIGETGVEMGWWYELDGAQAYGYFPGLGGWCTGIPMNSALPRYVWYCPTCQFATLGCCWVC